MVYTVEEVKEMLDRKGKGGVKQTLNNCVIALSNDPILAGGIKRNDLTCRTDIVCEVPWDRRGLTLTDTDYNQILLRLEVNYELNNDKNIRKAIDIVSSREHFHPIVDFLETLEWDGVERIRNLFHRYLGSDASEYVYEATKLLMLGAICRVYSPGCKFETMVCIVGGQGAGKSTMFRLLAIKDEWFTDDLRRMDDENVYRKLQGHWFVEMAEMLATSNSKSVEEIKAFISRQKETYKIPYETHPEDRPRQCVFVGTSNSIAFLPNDRTGNRRFMPIVAHPDKAECHILSDEKASRAFIIQCWAEAMVIYKSGNFKLTLPVHMEEELKKLQAEYMPEDTKKGVILEWLETCSEGYVCTRMIYSLALNKGYAEPTGKDIREIGIIMSELSDRWEPVSSHRFAEYGTQRGWKRIPVKIDAIEPQYTAGGFMTISDELIKEMPFR